MMKQATLVAFYGAKPPLLARLLIACQERVSRTAQRLGLPPFYPYELEQIHATLIGCERIDSAGTNRQFARWRQSRRVMDLAGFARNLLQVAPWPLWVRFGGYGRNHQPFTSRGESPYLRSLTVQGNKVVLMGWPVRGEASPEARMDRPLDALRREGQRFGVLHAYHRRPEDIDNDFYLRLGVFADPGPPEALCRELEGDLRRYLSESPPLIVSVKPGDISLVIYDDESLPGHSSHAWPLSALAEEGGEVASLIAKAETAGGGY